MEDKYLKDLSKNQEGGYIKQSVRSRAFSSLMKSWDYTSNDISPEEVLLDLNTEYNWICSNGHKFKRTIPQFFYEGCPECIRSFPHMKDFLDYILTSDESLAEMVNIIKNKDKKDKTAYSRNLQTCIAYASYMLENGFMSEEVASKLMKIGAVLHSDSNVDYILNEKLSIINSFEALKDIRQTLQKNGNFHYKTLKAETLLWLQFYIELNHRIRLPNDLIYKFKSLNLFDIESLAFTFPFPIYEPSKKTVEKNESEKNDVKKKDIREIRWNKMYRGLVKHYEKNGHFAYLNKEMINGINLHVWFKSQIESYKSGKMNNDRRRIFEESGLILKFENMKMINSSWLTHYEALKNFLQSNKWNGQIGSYTKFDGVDIGAWLQKQKELYKNDELCTVALSLFNEIDFNFSCVLSTENKTKISKDEKNSKWEYGLSQLLIYKENYGCVNVPFKFINEDEFDLGQWVYFQRKRYKENNMSPDRMMIYRVLGFDDENTMPSFKDGTTFETLKEFKDEIDWISYYDALVEFLATDNANINNINYPTLNQWVERQKALYKLGNLSLRRIEKLKSIGVPIAR